MAKFKLKRGRYSAGGKNYGGKTDKRVVKSDEDLVAKFGHEKFELITVEDDDEDDMPQPVSEVENKEEESPEESVDYNSYTVDELKAFAEEEEIDLSGAKTKADIIQVIKKALGE